MASSSYQYELEREYDESSEEEEDTDDSFDEGIQPGHAHTEMREQMYQDKLAELKQQLSLLQTGQLPEYVRRLRRLEATYRERKRVSEVIREIESDMVEHEFLREKKSAAREFEDHKVYLREQLVAELEEKQKAVEAERHNVELLADTSELKTISTRKLRRRPNELTSKLLRFPSQLIVRYQLCVRSTTVPHT